MWTTTTARQSLSGPTGAMETQPSSIQVSKKKIQSSPFSRLVNPLTVSHLYTVGREHILAQVKGAGSLPLVDEAYDVVVCSNGLAPGQIYPDAIEEMLRFSS